MSFIGCKGVAAPKLQDVIFTEKELESAYKQCVNVSSEDSLVVLGNIFTFNMYVLVVCVCMVLFSLFMFKFLTLQFALIL